MTNTPGFLLTHIKSFTKFVAYKLHQCFMFKTADGSCVEEKQVSGNKPQGAGNITMIKPWAWTSLHAMFVEI